jgi:hypothetical protein
VHNTCHITTHSKGVQCQLSPSSFPTPPSPRSHLDKSPSWRARKVEREPAQTTSRNTAPTRRSSRVAHLTSRPRIPVQLNICTAVTGLPISGTTYPGFRSRVSHFESSTGGTVPHGQHQHQQCAPLTLLGSHDTAAQIFAIFEGYACATIYEKTDADPLS